MCDPYTHARARARARTHARILRNLEDSLACLYHIWRHVIPWVRDRKDLMGPSPWEASSCSAAQILSIAWNPKVHCRVHRRPPLVCTMSPMNSVHTLHSSTPISVLLSFCLCLGLPSAFFPSGSLKKHLIHSPLFAFMLYVQLIYLGSRRLYGRRILCVRPCHQLCYVVPIVCSKSGLKTFRWWHEVQHHHQMACSEAVLDRTHQSHFNCGECEGVDHSGRTV
jgi:hypothetical protein